jgi:hypothetical protein
MQDNAGTVERGPVGFGTVWLGEETQGRQGKASPRDVRPGNDRSGLVVWSRHGEEKDGAERTGVVVQGRLGEDCSCLAGIGEAWFGVVMEDSDGGDGLQDLLPSSLSVFSDSP